MYQARLINRSSQVLISRYVTRPLWCLRRCKHSLGQKRLLQYEEQVGSSIFKKLKLLHSGSDDQVQPSSLSFKEADDNLSQESALARLKESDSCQHEDGHFPRLKQLIEVVDIYNHASEVYVSPASQPKAWSQQPDINGYDIADSQATKSPPHANKGSDRIESASSVQDQFDSILSIVSYSSASHPGTSSWRQLYHKYRQLKPPRAPKMSLRELSQLLESLATFDPDSYEHKTGDLRNAYFSIINDMIEHQLPVTVKQWNGAINLALKASRGIDSAAVEEAIKIWYRMDHHYKVPGDTTTFTMLYMAAIRASKFGIASRIWNRMARGASPLGRIGRICQMYAAGIRGDALGIVQAYQTFLQEAHLLDIDVWEMVIAAYIKADQVAAAEEVLARLWNLCSDDMLIREYMDWQEKRKVRRWLAVASEFHVEQKLLAQQSLQFGFTPSDKCYGLLIHHYAVTNGNLDRAMELLVEMQDRQIPTTLYVYAALFKGFDQHSQIKPSFTPEKLLACWGQYQANVLEPQRDMTKINAPLVYNLLRTFMKLGMDDEAHNAKRILDLHWSPHSDITTRIEEILNRF